MPFANIFSHSVSCLLLLLTIYLDVQRLFSWYSPICLFLFLFPLLEETDPKKVLLRQIAKSVLPYVSFRKLYGFRSTFKSLIYFDLFLYMVKKIGLVSHSFACSCPVFSASFIEKVVLSPLYILASYS